MSAGCSPRSTGGTGSKEHGDGTGAKLSNIDSRSFKGIAQLAEFVEAQGATAEMFDEYGAELKLETVHDQCQKGSALIKGFIVINDGDAKVFKRYKIANFCEATIKITRDFGYKNPYQ